MCGKKGIKSSFQSLDWHSGHFDSCCFFLGLPTSRVTFSNRTLAVFYPTHQCLMFTSFSTMTGTWCKWFSSQMVFTILLLGSQKVLLAALSVQQFGPLVVCAPVWLCFDFFSFTFPVLTVLFLNHSPLTFVSGFTSCLSHAHPLLIVHLYLCLVIPTTSLFNLPSPSSCASSSHLMSGSSIPIHSLV